MQFGRCVYLERAINLKFAKNSFWLIWQGIRGDIIEIEFHE